MKQMQRQTVRRLIGVTSLVLFPITLYYLSPVVPLGGLAAGVVTGSLIVFAALFVSALFVGRAFCGWLCPVGAFQDLLKTPDGKPRFNTGRLAVIRFVIFAGWLALIVIVLAQSGFPRSVDFTYSTTNGVSVGDTTGVIVLVAVLGLFALLTLFLGRRGGCRSICWIAPFMQAGSAVGRRLQIPQLMLVHTNGGRNVCPMALTPPKVAAANRCGSRSYQKSECVLCARCADLVPQTGVSFAWVRADRSRAAAAATAVLVTVAFSFLLPPTVSAESLHELQTGWSWVAPTEHGSALEIAFTHRGASPVDISWKASVPLTDDRNAFAPEATIGFGSGSQRTRGIRVWIDGTWRYLPYADEVGGIVAAGGGVAYTLTSATNVFGLIATVRSPIFSTRNHTSPPPGAVRAYLGATAVKTPWTLSIGCEYATSEFQRFVDDGSLRGAGIRISVGRIFDWKK